MGDGELVVVGVEPEEREIRVHDPDVDPVEGEILKDDVGVAFGHPAAGLTVAGDRPSFEAGRVQAPDTRPSVVPMRVKPPS